MRNLTVIICGNVAYKEFAIAGIIESDKTVSLQDKITLGIGTT